MISEKTIEGFLGGLALTVMLISFNNCGEKKKQEQVNEKPYDTDRVQVPGREPYGPANKEEIMDNLAINYSDNDHVIGNNYYNKQGEK